MEEAVPGVSEFRGVVHEAARRTGGEVTGFAVADSVTPNFHQGYITYGDCTISVLCSRDDGSVAVAEPCDESYGPPPVFLDEPGLVAVLSEFDGFTVRAKSELDQPFDRSNHPHVWPTDIKYWKPESTGEALFHYWD